jgi:transposase
MPYRTAGIDVHKKVLAVVVSDVEVDAERRFERRMFGSNPEQLQSLTAWLLEQEVEESGHGINGAILETSVGSTGTVLEAATRKAGRRRLEVGNTASSDGAIQSRAAGRKKDFPDAERLVTRLVARELTLSLAPDAVQRLWRTVTRRKYQLTRDHVRLQNQLESLLEEAYIKLSGLVSDLLGLSARRTLKALAEGETNPTAMATLADGRWRECGQT